LAPLAMTMSSGTGTLKYNWGKGYTATMLQKWSPLKIINLKFSDTQFAFYCTLE